MSSTVNITLPIQHSNQIVLGVCLNGDYQRELVGQKYGDILNRQESNSQYGLDLLGWLYNASSLGEESGKQGNSRKVRSNSMGRNNEQTRKSSINKEAQWEQQSSHQKVKIESVPYNYNKAQWNKLNIAQRIRLKHEPFGFKGAQWQKWWIAQKIRLKDGRNDRKKFQSYVNKLEKENQIRLNKQEANNLNSSNSNLTNIQPPSSTPHSRRTKRREQAKASIEKNTPFWAKMLLKEGSSSKKKKKDDLLNNEEDQDGEDEDDDYGEDDQDQEDQDDQEDEEEESEDEQQQQSEILRKNMVPKQPIQDKQVAIRRNPSRHSRPQFDHPNNSDNNHNSNVKDTETTIKNNNSNNHNNKQSKFQIPVGLPEFMKRYKEISNLKID